MFILLDTNSQLFEREFRLYTLFLATTSRLIEELPPPPVSAAPRGFIVNFSGNLSHSKTRSIFRLFSFLLAEAPSPPRIVRATASPYAAAPLLATSSIDSGGHFSGSFLPLLAFFLSLTDLVFFRALFVSFFALVVPFVSWFSLYPS